MPANNAVLTLTMRQVARYQDRSQAIDAVHLVPRAEPSARTAASDHGKHRRIRIFKVNGV